MELNEFERLDDLQLGGVKLFQDKRMFCFGIDAVLLANFATVKPGSTVLDMCSGNGIIPFILYAKTDAKSIHCIEIQPQNHSLIERSIGYNGAEDRVFPVCDDLKNWKEHYSAASFDVITCNPPYIKSGGGLLNPSDSKKCARHEIFCNLEDVVSAAAKMLVPGGRFTVVYRPDRLAELIFTLKSHKLEPKRMRLVHSRFGDKPNLVLLESTRGGNSELHIDPPLYVYKNENEYTDEIEKIYGRIK